LAKYLGEGTEPGASGESPMLLFVCAELDF